MWSAGSRVGRALDIYLSRSEVALVGADGSLWRREGDSLDIVLGLLVDRLREPGSPRTVRVWLGAALCRVARIAPIAGALSRHERLRLIESQAVAQSELVPPCRVSMDALGRGGDDTVAVVVEEAVLTAIELALASMRTRAISIRPWWAKALESALGTKTSLRAFGVWEGRALTTLVGEGEGFAFAHTSFPVGNAEAASAAFARTLVSAMIPVDDALAIALDWSALPGRVVHEEFADVTIFAPWIAPLGVLP